MGRWVIVLLVVGLWRCRSWGGSIFDTHLILGVGT
jgi:hypothetical protein